MFESLQLAESNSRSSMPSSLFLKGNPSIQIPQFLWSDQGTNVNFGTELQPQDIPQYNANLLLNTSQGFMQEKLLVLPTEVAAAVGTVGERKQLIEIDLY